MFPHPTTTTLKRALISSLLGFRAGVQRPDSTARAPPSDRNLRDCRFRQASGPSGLIEEPRALTLRRGRWLDWTAETEC
jgi:hypothetical protein